MTTEEQIYNLKNMVIQKDNQIMKLTERVGKLRSNKEELIKEIISSRDQITKPSALSNMLPENLSKYGKGFNAGVEMVLDILKWK